MFKNINATKIGVLIFIILLLVSLTYSEKSNAGEGYVTLGHSTFNSEFTSPSMGYRFDNNMDITIGYFGDGELKNEDHDISAWASLSYVVEPNFKYIPGYFMRIGVAYTPDINLVGDTNFRLGVGYDFGVWELELMHFSSAGTHHINTGIDTIGITVKKAF